MSFLSKLVGIGLVAGAAVAAVKLIEKVWPQDDALDDVVYTVETLCRGYSNQHTFPYPQMFF